LFGKITVALVALILVMTNLPTGCNSKNDETAMPATNTTKPTAETIIPQASVLPILTAEPIAIKAYDAEYMAAGAGFSAIKDICLLCHGPGTGQGDIQAFGVLPGGSQFPLPPTWVGSANMPGPWQITPGSAADHTGRTNGQCLYCHQAPGYAIYDI
jgi:fumarate hydratase class II